MGTVMKLCVSLFCIRNIRKLCPAKPAYTPLEPCIISYGGELSAAIFFRMKRYQLQAQGYAFDKIVDRVAQLFKMRPEEILSPGKQPERVRARSLVCYWAVKQLGMNGTVVARLLGIIQSSVSRAVRHGERLVLDKGNSLEGRG